MSCNNEKVTTPSSKTASTPLSSKTSTSSKISTPSTEKSPGHCFEDLRKNGSSGSVSPIVGYVSSSPHQDPFQPGRHPGQRAWNLFDKMNDIDDKLRAADAHNQASSKLKRNTKSRSK